MIESGRRPLVVQADFDRGRARLDATGRREHVLEREEASADRWSFTVVLGAGAEAQRLRFTGSVTIGDKSRMEGEVGSAGQASPFWLERLPELPRPRNRIEAWEQDLDAVRRRFLRYDRSFSEPQRAAARQRLAELAAGLEKKSDSEVLVELARVAGLSGNAHTRLYMVRNRTEVRRMPLRVWWFGDELRVVRAAEAQRAALGCRVTHIGGLPVEQAAARVRGTKAGNDSWQRYMSPYLLTSAEVLEGASVVRSAESVAYRLECDGRRREEQVSPLPLERSDEAVESWWDLAPGHAQAAALRPALARRGDELPLYLRRPNEHYWFERLGEGGVLFLQYNRSAEQPGGPGLREFTERFLRELESEAVRALVVDVRFNTGGDLGLAEPLVRGASEKLAGRRVVVLTGRATFSAGISHAAQWRQWAGARIVGEPVGDELDSWSEGGNVILPNSGLYAHYANGFHKYSAREYPERRPYFYELQVESLEPDVRVEPSWADYLAGRDPVLEQALRLLGRGVASER